jgi:hypothetical protein
MLYTVKYNDLIAMSVSISGEKHNREKVSPGFGSHERQARVSRWRRKGSINHRDRYIRLNISL